ncbi:MAG: CHAT domain-containing protein [Deltaproteobacteria bacterium]|nr:CHAT domain-containing protein [Deltaproteobacteria bacterium]
MRPGRSGPRGPGRPGLPRVASGRGAARRGPHGGLRPRGPRAAGRRGGHRPGGRRSARQPAGGPGRGPGGAGPRRAQLLQGFEATGAALRAGLAHAALLHYAGHGREHGGWGSELPLADGAALRVGDILALPRVPARVVLSGCETGAAAGEHGVGLGLAQAFILAGARGVVAATRPVPDAAARALMEALYTEDPSDLVGALHRAQARLRAHDPEADWAAFRIFVP